jgi:transposase
VGRKNWLFSASSKGAEAGACVYSIIKACKANNIDSEKYLIYLSTRMPNEERLKGEKILEKIHALEPCSAKILQIT